MLTSINISRKQNKKPINFNENMMKNIKKEHKQTRKQGFKEGDVLKSSHILTYTRFCKNKKVPSSVENWAKIRIVNTVHSV